MSTPVRAWAVQNSEGRLVAYGNGGQWQLPIFPTRKEAKAWQKESPWDRGKIVSVVVDPKGNAE